MLGTGQGQWGEEEVKATMEGKGKCRGRVGGRDRGSGKGKRGASKGRRERGVVVGVMQG